ncbi:MAG: chemotaxis protein CheX [Oscillospiraceae bacterium]|nr:chemotaxis protein CheX [Oscillospiraceae bacterium]
MFTQFFGNYLFNEKLVTKQQLIEALEMQKFARAKLGVLAINAGYMTAAQVDEVHAEQQRMDKRFGDIAVDKGYMTESQVETLLSNQKQAHLVIGQALVDKGYLTNEQFANALAKYKENNLIEERDFTDDQNRKIDTIIRNFYIFNTFESDVEFFTEYTSLVFKNIIRFIGDDFIPLAPEAITSYKAEKISYQMVNGKGEVFTAIEGPETAMIEFAKRYSHEELNSFDELTRESVAEFLNLHNGLFTVNMSNNKQIELQLEPQISKEEIELSTKGSMFVMPICFPFGTISVIISSDKIKAE